MAQMCQTQQYFCALDTNTFRTIHAIFWRDEQRNANRNGQSRDVVFLKHS